MLESYESKRGDKICVDGESVKGYLGTLKTLLLPPSRNVPMGMKPLAEKEVGLVFKWLEVLNLAFEELPECGLRNELLQNQSYHDLGDCPALLQLVNVRMILY